MVGQSTYDNKSDALLEAQSQRRQEQDPTEQVLVPSDSCATDSQELLELPLIPLEHCQTRQGLAELQDELPHTA